MNVRFGNLSVAEFERRLGADFINEDRQYLEEHRVDLADFKDSAKFHIFELPFVIECGPESVQEVLAIVKKHGDGIPAGVELALVEKDLPSPSHHQPTEGGEE